MQSHLSPGQATFTSGSKAVSADCTQPYSRFNKMKKILSTLVAAATFAFIAGHPAYAANVTWTGASGGDWSVGTNWSGNAAPTSTGTAVFNTNTFSSVVNSSGTSQNALSISFDTGAGSITISGTTNLLLATGGTIQMTGSLTNTGLTESINVPLVIGSAAAAATYTIANNYTDSTSTLAIGGNISGGTTSTVALTLSGTNTGNNIISGNISNGSATPLSLTKSGAGNWTLSGSNSYTGATTVTTGTLTLSGTLGSTNVVINNAAATFNETSAGVIGASGSFTQSAGIANLAGSNTYTGPTSISGGTMNLTGTLNGTAITVSGTAGAFLNETSTGLIAGSALTKITGGTMTLAGSNTSSGGVSVSGGLLNLANASALGTGTFTLTGGTVDNTTGSALTIAGNNAKSFGGTVVFADTNALNLGTGATTLTASSNINVAGAALTDGGVYSGAFTLTKSGTGTLILTDASNTSSITTLTVSAGTLNIAGQFNTSSTSSIAAGATLSISGHNTKLTNGGILTIAGTLLLDDRGAGNATASQRLVDSSGVTLSNQGSFVYQGSDVTFGSFNLYTGAVALGSGISTITVQSNNGNTAKYSISGGITHAVGTGGLALVNGTNLGIAAPSTTAGVANLIATAPTLIGGTAATIGINAGVYNTKIAPFFLGESGMASGQNGTVTGTANTFVTYETGTAGFRPLNPTDEFFNTSSVTSSGSITSGAVGDNIYVSSNATAGVTESINSMVINGGDLAINSGTTLTDASGALLFVTSNNLGASTGSVGTLAFGSVEEVIAVDSGVNATISANMTGTGSLTFYGGVGSSITLSG